MRKALFILLCVTGCCAAQSWHTGGRAGLSMMAPLPVQLKQDSSSGSLIPGAEGGLFFAYRISKRWMIGTGLHYMHSGASWSQEVSGDTLVAVEIFPGRIDTIPSYYKANLQGRISNHYVGIPLYMQFDAGKRLRLLAGGQLNCRVGGRDDGEIRVRIGEGTLVPDDTLAFSGTEMTRRIGFTGFAGVRYSLPFGLFIEARVMRSLTSLYRRNATDASGNAPGLLFDTGGCISLGWIWEKQKS